MSTVREFQRWEDVHTAPASGAAGWAAAVGVMAALVATLALLVASTARAPISFEQLPEVTQAP